MIRTRRFIVISTIVSVLAAAPFFLGGFLLPVHYTDTFLGEFPYKYHRLCDTRGKKIVIIGGSGMAFGVDCRRIEENLQGYHAVNMGMYADLGTRLVLDITEKHLGAGDIAVIAPEQNEHALSLHIGGRSALQAFDGAWGILKDVRKEEIGSLIGALPRFSMEKWRLALNGEQPKGEGIYARSSFNEYGDIESPLAGANQMPDLYDPDLPVSYDPDVMEEDFAAFLCRFARSAQRKGAEVYFAFCPANRLAVRGNPEEFYSYLEETLCFPLLGDPGNSVMEEEWFYDTNFHLNQSGRILYTRQLIRDLKAWKGITTATDIAVPPLPRPAMLQGTVLAADQWAGNEEITRIDIPADVIRIEDYAFSGCTQLREIHLWGTRPSRIQVGEHLLDGTDAYLYVPPESLSAYRTDYRFSRYAEKLKQGTVPRFIFEVSYLILRRISWKRNS